ncbi:hypothetical protein [Chondromyces apiculatus]|uniref:Uncharacterized protein n=1 Tax=Chondromyces apiculatus DSM 436 TaxID=1192034 RepID=A0A017T4S1_9BACT|nr:hypothetical protein [Chondromyces apiculatus]EYF04229.1 Hypothetical protein CAP_4706 [Chondromyces apiculatus DSM 436]
MTSLERRTQNLAGSSWPLNRLFSRFCFLATALLLLAAGLAGCGPLAPGSGAIVVGVTSELRVGVDIAQIHILLRVSGATVRDEWRSVAEGTLTLPAEIQVDDLDDGAEVEVALEAFRPDDPVKPLILRSAATRAVSGKTLLLRVPLQRACVLGPSDAGCGASETCIGGQCVDPHVDPATLDEYTSEWSTAEDDVCKPDPSGLPEVIVGKGQGDFLPLKALDEMQVEAGPQGGHHIWIALRVKNLRRSGSITSIRGYLPELDHQVRSFDVIFSFDPDEGGYCSLHGLRFQIDHDLDIDQMLGKVMDVQVTVTDPDGAIGEGAQQITLSDAIL